MKSITDHWTDQALLDFKLPRGEKQIVLRDNHPKARLRLRMSAGGKRQWFVRREVKGVKQQNWNLGLFPTLGVVQAREQAMKLHTALNDRTHSVFHPVPSEPMVAAEEIKTVNDALATYCNMKQHVLAERTVSDFNKDIAKLGWGFRDLESITDAEVQFKMNDFVKEGHVSTGISAMKTLRLLFRFAIRRKAVTYDPTAYLTEEKAWPNHVPQRHRFENEQDWTTAFIIASEWSTESLSDFYRWLALSGLRPWGELAQLQWNDIRLSTDSYIIRGENLKVKGAKRLKSNREENLELPLTAPLREIAERRMKLVMPKDRSNPHVFPTRMGNAKTRHLSTSAASHLMKAIRENVGYHVQIYSLRRFFIEQMRKINLQPEARMYLVDHSPMQNIQQGVYDAIRCNDVRQEAIRLTDHLVRLIEK